MTVSQTIGSMMWSDGPVRFGPTISTSAIASIASRISINEVTISDDCVFKSRKRFTKLHRTIGNFFLRQRQAPVQVLDEKEWFAREKELADAQVINRKLKLKKLEGIPLSEFLKTNESIEARAMACEAAVKALFDFHEHFGQSHGDASATNVMITEQPDGDFQGTWFDFDVAHTGKSQLLNRTDDLAALLFTSRHWPNPTHSTERTYQSYPDQEIWRCLGFNFEQQVYDRDVFHNAQVARAGVPKPTSITGT